MMRKLLPKPKAWKHVITVHNHESFDIKQRTKFKSTNLFSLQSKILENLMSPLKIFISDKDMNENQYVRLREMAIYNQTNKIRFIKKVALQRTSDYSYSYT